MSDELKEQLEAVNKLYQQSQLLIKQIDDGENAEEALAQLKIELANAKDSVNIPDVPQIIEATAQMASWMSGTNKIKQLAHEPDGVLELAQLLEANPNVLVTSAIFEALSKSKDERAFEPLLQKATDSSYSTQVHAVIALGKLGDKRAVEPLLRMAQDKKSPVRYHAIEALGLIGDKRTFEPLLKATNDRNTSAKCAAIKAIAQIDGPRAIEPIMVALSKRNQYVQVTAIEALGEVGDQRAIPAIEPFLTDMREVGQTGWVWSYAEHAIKLIRERHPQTASE